MRKSLPVMVSEQLLRDRPPYGVGGYFQPDQSFKAEESNLLKMTSVTFNSILKSEKIQNLVPAEL